MREVSARIYGRTDCYPGFRGGQPRETITTVRGSNRGACLPSIRDNGGPNANLGEPRVTGYHGRLAAPGILGFLSTRLNSQAVSHDLVRCMRHMRSHLLVFSAVSFLACGSSVEFASGLTAAFIPVNGLNGEVRRANVYSTATDISADGSIFVGWKSEFSAPGSVRVWTVEGHEIAIELENALSTAARATALSAKGSIIVGVGDTKDPPPFPTIGGEDTRAIFWDSDGAMLDMGILEPESIDKRRRSAEAVSADGSVVVGFTDKRFTGSEAFIWTAETGMVGLGYLPGGGALSHAAAISADGSMVVGSSDTVEGIEAFRWTKELGMVGLGDLPGGNRFSSAKATNVDGTVIVGESSGEHGREAFYWVQDSGMIGLGDLPGGEFNSSAYDVSEDGAVIVGTAWSELGSEPVIWTLPGGMHRLENVLIAGGVDLTGWQLLNVFGVSADGRILVGNGYNEFGDLEGWITELNPTAGDFDWNGDVTGRDFLSWQRSLGGVAPRGSDLQEWQTNFGGFSSPTSIGREVPEPCCLLMAVMSLLATSVRSRSPRHGNWKQA